MLIMSISVSVGNRKVSQACCLFLPQSYRPCVILFCIIIFWLNVMYAYLIYQLCIKVQKKSSSVLGIELSKEKLMVGLAFSSKTPWSVSEALRASRDYNKPQRHHQRVGRSCKTRWGPWLKRPTRCCWRCRGPSEGPALCFNLLVSGLSDSSALRWLHFKSLSYNMCFLISCLWLFTFVSFLQFAFHLFSLVAGI